MDQAAQELITRHNEQMRELIVRDIDALENKLNVKRQVSHKADEAMGKVKGKLGMNQDNQNQDLAGFVRSNAVPLLTIGLGGSVLARNLRNRFSSSSSQTTTTRYVSEASYEPTEETSGGLRERVASAASSAQESTSGGAGAAKEKVAGAKETVTEKAAGAKDTVTEKAATARDVVSDQAVHAKDVVVETVPSREQTLTIARDHNQLLGLAALAAGALAGTFAPRTKAEERRLAPLQAQVKERATDVVEESVEKAKERAERATEALSSAGDMVKEEVMEGEADDAGDAAERDLPDLTQPNRITGSKSASQSSVTTS